MRLVKGISRIFFLAAILFWASTCGAIADSYNKTLTTDIVIDGQTFENTTQFTWEADYPVPAGGISWNGDDEYIYITYPEENDIIEAPDGQIYIDGQLVFTARISGETGAEFPNIQQLMASYGIKIIGYIAPTATYQVEVMDKITYGDLLALRDKIATEPWVIGETVNISYLEAVETNATIGAKYEFGDKRTSSQSLWYGDALNESYPEGKNWGMEFTEAVSAWKYTPISYPIDCSVWDGGYYLHHDIDITPLIIPSQNNSDKTVSEMFCHHGTHVAGIFAANHDSYGVSGVFDTIKLYGITNKSQFSFFYSDEQTQTTLESTFAYADLVCLVTSVVRPGSNAKDIPVVVNHSMGRGLYLSGTENEAERKEIIRNIRCAWALQTGQEIQESWFEAKVSDWSRQQVIYTENILRLDNMGYKFLIVQTSGNSFYSGLSDISATIDARYNSPLCDLTGNADDHIIVVGAIGWGGGPFHADFSSVGDCVDMLAPGVDIWSTYGENEYAYGSGTSMAAPHVAGTAAFAWSIDPDFAAKDVKRFTNYTSRYITKRADDTCRTTESYPLLNVSDAINIGRQEARVSTLKVHVYDERGIPVSHAQLLIQEDAVNLSSTTTSSDGSAQFTIMPGVYVVSAYCPGYQNAQCEVYLQAGTTSEITLELMEKDIKPTDSPVATPTASPVVTATPSPAVIATPTPTAALGYIHFTAAYEGRTDLTSVQYMLYHIDKDYYPMRGATSSLDVNWATSLLPAGNYRLTLSKDGYGYDPAVVEFELPASGASVDLGTITLNKTTSTPTVAPGPTLSCTLSVSVVDFMTTYTLQCNNVQGEIVNFDVAVSNKNILLLDTAQGLVYDSTIITDDQIIFQLDDELINGAIMSVSATDSSGQTFSGAMYLTIAMDGSYQVPSED